MIIMKKTLYFVAMLSCFVASAQDQMLTFMPGVPQNRQVNPAFAPKKGGYFTLPGLGSVQLGMTNTGFAWGDVIRPGSGLQADSLVVDLDHLAGRIKPINALMGGNSVQLFGFGFSAGASHFSFDITNKTRMAFRYPGSILDLRYGNWNYDQDKPINHSFSDMFSSGMNYTEVALGYSRQINEKIRVGATFKYLLGHASFKTERFNVGVETTSEQQMLVKADASIVSSFPLMVEYDEEGYVDGLEYDDDVAASKIIMSKNRGIALDLGMTWDVLDNLTLGASVTDLGFINWKEHTNRFSTNNTFVFNGVDVGDEITGNEADDRDYWEELGDSLTNSFKVSGSQMKYKTMLQGSVNLMANYKFEEWLHFGAVSRHYMVDGTWLPNLNLSVGLHPGKALSTVVSYGVSRNDLANIGLGLMFRGGPLQLYLLTDNLDAAFWPHKAKMVNARFGINFII